MNTEHAATDRAVREEVAEATALDLSRAVDRYLVARMRPGVARLRAEGWLGAEHAEAREPIEIAAVIVIR